jgi:hypothetical protein
MRKTIGVYFITTFAVLLTMTVTVYAFNSNTRQNKARDKAELSERDAVLKVIKDHSDFPSDPSIIVTKKLPTGGPYGSTANVKFTTEAQKINGTTYTVTLTKDWGITVNGKYAESFWKYTVTPDNVILTDSVDNDYLPSIIK